MLTSRRRLLCLCMLALLPACQRDGPSLRVERVLLSPAAGIVTPNAWAATYRDVLTSAGAVDGVSRHAAGVDTAAGEVVAGRARFALTSAEAATGLATREFDAPPLALLVPLTLPVEAITTRQARDIALGRITDWRALDGPPAPLLVAQPDGGQDESAVARALGVPLAQPSAAAGESAGVRVTFQVGGAPALGQKALRVDGGLPGEDGYPLVDRRVVAGRPEDRLAVESLGDELRRLVAESRPVEITLDAVGDIMLGRSVGGLIAERGPAYPFDRVRPAMAAADIRFGNLELPLTERGTPANKNYVFRAPPSVTEGLVSGGFNLLSISNNHTLDYGTDGLLDTIAALDQAGIPHAGAGAAPEEAHAPAIVTVKGVRIALLAYTNVPNDSGSGFVAESMAVAPGKPGIAWGRADAVRRDVAAARSRADVVIVSLHSGFEYTPNPNPIQRELARAAVDAGAALVLGGHPHVLQGVEFYRDVPIIYSLGNFIFDLDDDDRRQPGLPSVLSVIFRVKLDARGVRSVSFIPVVIDARDGLPAPVSGAEARPVLDRLYRLTDALNPKQP